jgi:DNA (cytosine-5)-methyltransferase 3A
LHDKNNTLFGNKGLNVLSLCDGMSCGQIALTELGFKINNYYASEIDKVAIKCTQDNFPNTIQLGDVTKITDNVLQNLPKIDLVMFGSPCRSLSKTTMGRSEYNNGLKGSSSLFYSCAKILKWIQTNNNSMVSFLVENVNSNHKDDIHEMSKILGVEPVLINANLFSAQDRARNYWTNISINKLPDNCSLVLRDIMDSDVDEKYYYTQSYDYYDGKKVCAILHINGHDILKRVNNPNYKSPTLTACRGGNLQKKVYDHGRCRKLTPHEYRILQTIPEWYKMDFADSHIYNMCGDGWCIEVIKHILKGLIRNDG